MTEYFLPIDITLIKEIEINGRKVEYFTHKSRSEWGYSTEQTDTLVVLHPKEEKSNVRYPLDVVFHSAGHDVHSCVECIRNKGDHDIYHTPEGMYGLFLDCCANGGDWWWGGTRADFEGIDLEHSGAEPKPVENRCIASIEWVLQTYPTDRNRVYAVGNSMGGSGSLGIALCRGDIFAAIKANVPAGVRHAADRCCFDVPAPQGFKIPDPPIVIDYSAQNDSWSKGHEILYNAMHDFKYQIFGFWGMFGHENNNEKIAIYNDLVHSVDVWSFRLDEAYPVFTDASTDDVLPWPDTSSTAAGQRNGYFHWCNVSETENEFAITLKLLSNAEWKTRVSLPVESTADITFRRLKKFCLKPGEEFEWFYADKKGTGFATKDGRPQIDRITICQTAQKLIIKRK